MRRMIAAATLIPLLTLAMGTAHADRLGKGSSKLSIAVSGHTGQYVTPGFPFRVTLGEVGAQVAYDRFLSDHWTLGISASYHVGNETTEEKNPNGSPFGKLTIDTRSVTVRIGGDRYAFIDDHVGVFAGAGVIVVRGRWKVTSEVYPPAIGGGSSEGPTTTEIGLDPRVGMYVRLGGRTAVFGSVGYVLSHTSVGDTPEASKMTWWASAPEGCMGVALEF